MEMIPETVPSSASAPVSAERQRLEQALPMWKIVLSQFLEHKMAVAGAVVIVLFMALALSAPLIETMTGLDPDAQNVFSRYQPPMTRTVAGQDARETTIERLTLEKPALTEPLQKALVEKSLVTTSSPEEALFELTTKTTPEALQILDQVGTPEARELKKVFRGFESFHLFGTDELGRDVFIRLVYGTRISMSVGILVAVVSALVGLLIGSIAGFYGGMIDTLLMRATDALLSLPLLPVMIVIAAVDIQKVPLLNHIVGAQNESILKMIVILCLFSWMTGGAFGAREYFVFARA